MLLAYNIFFTLKKVFSILCNICLIYLNFSTWEGPDPFASFCPLVYLNAVFFEFLSFSLHFTRLKLGPANVYTKVCIVRGQFKKKFLLSAVISNTHIIIRCLSSANQPPGMVIILYNAAVYFKERENVYWVPGIYVVCSFKTINVISTCLNEYMSYSSLLLMEISLLQIQFP